MGQDDEGCICGEVETWADEFEARRRGRFEEEGIEEALGDKWEEKEWKRVEEC